MKLTKDEKYEIEKILDIYAGWVNDKLNQYCSTAINFDAIHKDELNPMSDTISELVKTQRYLELLRDKFKIDRLSK